jgi:hypothetical protein
MVAVTLALVSGACAKKKKDPSSGDVSCEAVGEYAMTITKRGIDDLQGKAKKHAQAGLTGLLPEVRKNTIARCKKEKWPETLRRCYLRARDYADAEACGKAPGAKSAPSPKAAKPAKPVPSKAPEPPSEASEKSSE